MSTTIHLDDCLGRADVRARANRWLPRCGIRGHSPFISGLTPALQRAVIRATSLEVIQLQFGFSDGITIVTKNADPTGIRKRTRAVRKPYAGRLHITNPPREWSAQQMAATSYLFLTNRLDDLFAASFFA
jgi:hypothetical protein